ncbi:MAG: winged helix-turn-helix transcriptional regulator [Oscillospiraceae bacterium]|nr:winged helix-turn-helix transcriptional regulator [Oscillospiraceae bacterium]
MTRIFRSGAVNCEANGCLRELESDGLVSRTVYPTIPPAVEYALTERGKTLNPALQSIYSRAVHSIPVPLSSCSPSRSFPSR